MVKPVKVPMGKKHSKHRQPPHSRIPKQTACPSPQNDLVCATAPHPTINDHSGDHVAGSDDDRAGRDEVLSRWRDPNTYIALGTIGLVVIGLVAAWISRDSERRQLRGYVGIAPDKVVQTREGLWALEIVAHNYGQTPARALQINGGWLLLHVPLEKGEEIPTRAFAYSRTEESSGLDIFPSKDGATHLPPFSPADLAMLKSYSGPLGVYVAGTATYQDVFGKLWQTTFCAVIEPKAVVAVIDKPGTSVTFEWCAIKYNHAT